MKFDHTRTDKIPRNKLEASLQEELRALHGVGMDSQNVFNRYSVTPWALVRMSRILAILSRQADIQTRRVVRLTWALLILTFALVFLTVYLCYDVYQKGTAFEIQAGHEGKSH